MEADNKKPQNIDVRELDLEELKNFINAIQETKKDENSFKPERLQNLREKSIVRAFNSGLSS